MKHHQQQLQRREGSNECSSCSDGNVPTHVNKDQNNVYCMLLSVPEIDASVTVNRNTFNKKDELPSSLCSSCQTIYEQMIDHLKSESASAVVSNITGGTLLHILIHRSCCWSNNHCCHSSQLLLQQFLIYIMKSTCSFSQGTIYNARNYNNNMFMILSHDRFGNLPIHIAANSVRIAMTTNDSDCICCISIQLFQQVLEHTYRSFHQHCQRYINRSTLPVNCHDGCKKLLLQCDEVFPCVLSRNQFGLTVMDYVIIQYIDFGTKKGSTSIIGREHRCYTNVVQSKNVREYYALLQQYVNVDTDTNNFTIPTSTHDVHYNTHSQLPHITNINNKQQCIPNQAQPPPHASIILSNLVLPFIIPIICAAYKELQLLLRIQLYQQYRNYHHHGYCVRDVDLNRPSIAEKSQYILHFACALSGPCRYNFYNSTSQHTKTRYDNLMQIHRSILELLLVYNANQKSICGYGTCYRGLDVQHPITGQLPLHFAIQANRSIQIEPCYPEHEHKVPKPESTDKGNYDDKDYSESVREWEKWIQTIVLIYPNACNVRDRNGYIPLHYALLLLSPTTASTSIFNICYQSDNIASLPSSLMSSGMLFTMKCNNLHYLNHTGNRKCNIASLAQGFPSLLLQQHNNSNMHNKYHYEIICTLLQASPSSVDMACPIKLQCIHHDSNCCCSSMERTEKQKNNIVVDGYPSEATCEVYLDVYQLAALMMCTNDDTETDPYVVPNTISHGTVTSTSHCNRSFTENTTSSTVSSRRIPNKESNDCCIASLDLLYNIIRTSPSRLSSSLISST